MNQTKKITQGAMMLAIVGALILLDRMAAYWFTEFIVLMMPVVIIIYATMHTLKDGMLLSVGLIIISFLLGNFQFTYLIYVPVGILTGLSYAWGISKNMSKRSLLLIAMATYTLGEIIATFIVYPLLGFPVGQMITEYQEAFGEMQKFSGLNYSEIFASMGLSMTKILGILFVISTIIMGITEGILIHLLSVFLLKRFKIKDLGQTNIFEIGANPPLAYLSLLAISSVYLNSFVENETFYYATVIFAILGGLVLFYYGYIFLVLYGYVVIHFNIAALFIILAIFIPGLFMLILILGFLYASGPLRVYIERKAVQQKK